MGFNLGVSFNPEGGTAFRVRRTTAADQFGAQTLARLSQRQVGSALQLLLSGMVEQSTAWQSASPAQSESAQSTARSQSLSMPSPQRPNSLLGGMPQSWAQEQADSLPSQVPSPQKPAGPQSSAQLRLSSGLSQVRSPQQVLLPAPWGVSVQLNPPVVHRASEQPTGFDPLKPQQKRLLGFPDWTPSQSWGQVTQSSPSPASHRPLPQSKPGSENDGQSRAQLSQSSPGSQVPSPQTEVQTSSA